MCALAAHLVLRREYGEIGRGDCSEFGSHSYCGTLSRERMDAMPKRFPDEFKRDVVRVARRGDLSIAELAADFDISVESVRRWMHQATSTTGSETA